MENPFKGFNKDSEKENIENNTEKVPVIDDELELDEQTTPEEENIQEKETEKKEENSEDLNSKIENVLNKKEKHF